MRRLVDAQGREWRIYERLTADPAPGARSASLVFDTEGLVRRLWRYPSAWDALPDSELLALMDAGRREYPIA